MTLEKTLHNLRLAKSHYFSRIDKDFPLGKVVFVKDNCYEGFVKIVGYAKFLRFNINKAQKNNKNVNTNYYILGELYGQHIKTIKHFYFDIYGKRFSDLPINCRYFKKEHLI
jgi:hypothetical protein